MKIYCFALLHCAKSSNFGLLPDIKILIQGQCGPEKRRGKSAKWGLLSLLSLELLSLIIVIE